MQEGINNLTTWQLFPASELCLLAGILALFLLIFLAGAYVIVWLKIKLENYKNRKSGQKNNSDD